MNNVVLTHIFGTFCEKSIELWDEKFKPAKKDQTQTNYGVMR